MNILDETKSTAARFIAEHENLQQELTNAKLALEDQRKEIERLDAKLSIQSDTLAQANTDRNTYLQYSFELSAQLQFIVSGSARALMIAAQVRNKIAMQASGIPPVAGADIAELNGILDRIGDVNAAASDGIGMTTTVADVARVAIKEDGIMVSPRAEPPPLPGFLVDQNGKPMQPSAATLSMQQPLAS